MGYSWQAGSGARRLTHIHLLPETSATNCAVDASALPQQFQHGSDQRAQIAYVLVSFPLDVTWALSLFRTSSYTERLRQLSNDANVKVLFVYGDADQFTKAKVSNLKGHSMH